MLLWGAPINKDYIGNNCILGSKSKLGVPLVMEITTSSDPLKSAKEYMAGTPQP